MKIAHTATILGIDDKTFTNKDTKQEVKYRTAKLLVDGEYMEMPANSDVIDFIVGKQGIASIEFKAVLVNNKYGIKARLVAFDSE